MQSFALAQGLLLDHRRHELLCIIARIEQLIAEAGEILAGETDDDVLLRTSKLLAEHNRMLADLEGS
jgi:hypothetical protein